MRGSFFRDPGSGIREPATRDPGVRRNFFLNMVLKNEDILLPKIEQAFEKELFP